MDVGELLELMRERLVSRPFLFGAIVLCFGHSITTFLWRYWGSKGKIKESSHPSPAALIHKENMVPHKPKRNSEKEMESKSSDFSDLMGQRQSVRCFSRKSVPFQVIRNLVKTAGTTPSWAETQPWSFVVVETTAVKEKIRTLMEKDEEMNYKQRMVETLDQNMERFFKNSTKECLTGAPYLVVVLKQMYGRTGNGDIKTHYYNDMSACMSCGVLLAAIHNAGLATVTAIPVSCGDKLRELLGRPENETPVLVLPIGYPGEDCKVPSVERRPVEEILTVM